MQIEAQDTVSTKAAEVEAHLRELGWIPPEKAAQAIADFHVMQDHHLACIALRGGFVAAEDGSLAASVMNLMRGVDRQHNMGLQEAAMVVLERNDDGYVWDNAEKIANIILSLKRRVP
jgi:hypothetical protein